MRANQRHGSGAPPSPSSAHVDVHPNVGTYAYGGGLTSKDDGLCTIPVLQCGALPLQKSTTSAGVHSVS